MKETKKLCSIFLVLTLILSLLPVSLLQASEAKQWWDYAGDAGITNDTNLPGRTSTLDGWLQSYFFAPLPDGTVYLFEYRGTPVVSGQTFKIPAATSNGQVANITGAMYQQPVFTAQDRQNLTSVELPNNGRFTTIGNDSFRGCTNLSEVTLPPTLVYIGLSAFQDCSSLTSLVIPPSVMGIAPDAFKNTAPNFTIHGVPGTAAHLYATYHQIPFVSTEAEYLTLDLPENTRHQTLTIGGYANAAQVQIYVNDVLTNDAVSVHDFSYAAELKFPAEGEYNVAVVADYGGREVRVTKTITYDASLPELLSFYAYSEAHNSTGPVNLLLPGLALPILWHQNGRPYTFEIKLDETVPVTKVYVVSERNGEQKTMEANWDAKKQMWIASGFFDPTDLTYVPGKLSVWCEWGEEIDGSDLIAGIEAPDRESKLLLGVGARAFVPGDNDANGKYKKISPNSGKNNLAPGLSVITTKGSKQWTIVVDEEAVGKEFIFWAHAGGHSEGEFIYVTFPAAGRYLIGSEDGMQHMALIQHAKTPVRSGTIADGKCRIIIDPSGYVFEAVPSNRLTDVKTTIYYMGDENGNLIDRYTETPVGKAYAWNAEDFEQVNPILTDSDGVYAWDVPDGWWQVKYERDGYETMYSDWMPVPPEQRDVNVGLISTAAPTIAQVNAYPKGIEITFSKYMNLDTLIPENFSITQGDTAKVSGKIELVNPEYNQDESAQYASIIRFVPDQELSGQIQLTVNKAVKSYANTELAQTYTKTLSIRPEPKSITAENLHLAYDEQGTMTVKLEPAAAVAGMTLKATSVQPYIAAPVNDEVSINENGEAKFQIIGNLPGTAQMDFTLPDTLLHTQANVTIGLPNQFDYQVENISILSESGEASITTLDGTLRMTAAVLPTNATNRAVSWSVEKGTGDASIDNTGLLTAVSNGTVTVKATANDGSGAFHTFPITISGQAPSIKGTAAMQLTEGYQTVSTKAYQIIGRAPITIEKTSGDAKITWNDSTKKLDIAAGLKAGTYPVTLTASNGSKPNAEFTFTLTIKSAPIPDPEPAPTPVPTPDPEPTPAPRPTASITKVSISPATVTIVKGKGKSKQFTAKVTGRNTSSQTVIWKVSGHKKSGTMISTTGMLIIASNETANKLTVTATSALDKTKYATAVVQLVDHISLSPVKVNIVKGKTKQFSAKVEGQNATAKTVKWKVSGNKKKGTKISTTGRLLVAANETASKLIVTAASVRNKTKYMRATVQLIDPFSITPVKVNVTKGKTKQFTPKVEGKTVSTKAVKWKLSGNKTKATKISKTGKLIVSSKETARKLTITATLAKDKKKTAKATVAVIKPKTSAPNSKTVPSSRKVKKGSKITLKSPKNITLYYTLNGKKPTAKSAKVTSATSKKITINKNTTLRVYAAKKNYLNSSVVTRIYKIK